MPWGGITRTGARLPNYGAPALKTLCSENKTKTNTPCYIGALLLRADAEQHWCSANKTRQTRTRGKHCNFSSTHAYTLHCCTPTRTVHMLSLLQLRPMEVSLHLSSRNRVLSTLLPVATTAVCFPVLVRQPRQCVGVTVCVPFSVLNHHIVSLQSERPAR